jgi:hypothetical protein
MNEKDVVETLAWFLFVLLFAQSFICIWLVVQLRKAWAALDYLRLGNALSTDHGNSRLRGGTMKNGGINRAPQTPKSQIQLPPMKSEDNIRSQ